jgi:uncharacterized protein YyaL (SSP411 family)
VQEFAVIGDPAGDETKRVLRAIFARFRPDKVVALKSPAAKEDKTIGLLKDKSGQGAVTTYICQNFACQAPLVGAEAAEKALQAP